MRITKKVNTTKEITTAVLCNCCGEDCYGEGLIEASVTGGYASAALGDCASYGFSVCETCLWDFMQTFKIAPDFRDRCSDDLTYEEWQKLEPAHYATMTKDPQWRLKAREWAYPESRQLDSESSASEDAEEVSSTTGEFKTEK